MTTVLMSSRHSEDDQALWRAATKRGWPVARARGLHVPIIDDLEIIIYVEALFGPQIARQLNRKLHEPPEDWLANLPFTYVKREIRLMTVEEARLLKKPTFVKPPNDKSFLARIYQNGQDLPSDLENNSLVLSATPVTWELEVRCFCLDGNVITSSPYLRSGKLAKLYSYEMTDDESREATEIVENLLAHTSQQLPRSIVIDVGKIEGKGWAVVEANGAWGSGIYGCDPDLVLDVIRHASCTLDDSQESHIAGN